MKSGGKTDAGNTNETSTSKSMQTSVIYAYYLTTKRLLLHSSITLFVNQLLPISFVNLHLSNLNPLSELLACSFTVKNLTYISLVKPLYQPKKP